MAAISGVQDPTAVGAKANETDITPQEQAAFEQVLGSITLSTVLLTAGFSKGLMDQVHSENQE